MQGRRKEARFIPSAPWHAAVQMLDEVVLERAEANDVWVVADQAMERGETLTLEIAAGGLRPRVTVIDCEPLVVDGALRYRVRLQLAPAVDAPTLPEAMPGDFGVEADYGS